MPYGFPGVSRILAVVDGHNPFRKLVSCLSSESTKGLLYLAAEIAVNHGAYDSPGEYFAGRAAEKSTPFEVVTELLEDIASDEINQSLLMGEVADLLRPTATDRKTAANLLAYATIARPEATALARDLLKLLELHGDPLPTLDELDDTEATSLDNAGRHNLLVRRVDNKFDHFVRLWRLGGFAATYDFYRSIWAIPTPRGQSGGQLVTLGDATDALIAEVAKTPQAIYRLSGREFERFLKRLFEGFGYEVQLTSASRDGGIDLLCLSQEHGIPLVVAVEAKRYAAERVITVQLVRSFVGANAQWHANKLVYVTTSRFTKAAVEYAGQLRSQLLTLADLPMVIDWVKHHEQP